MPFNPTDELTMTFTVVEWNQVLDQLRQGPYMIVSPLINKISIQAAQHEQASRQAGAGLAAGEQQHTVDFGYTNGALLTPDLTPGG